MPSLTCPKCQGPMRTYERSGVTVDQCTECRGVFLDRGELERLVDAEQAWHSSSRAAPPPVVRGPMEAPPRYDRGGGYGYGHPRKRKSFLSELFDD